MAEILRPLELMAPAGGPEAGYAALAYGADAIYLGLPHFSARAEAANFTLEEVEAITAFAHAQKKPRRVFAALNTLILQRELDAVIESLGALSEIGVDALIVQDLGVFRLAKRHFPAFRLHASTQMAVHNRAGVEQLRELGFHRATLARELTLEEIRECAAVPGIEVETFIHGTLCYAYSGLCLMSSHLLGRSGNRGRCAYLCRDRFVAGGAAEGSFLFNMKDLALPDQAEALRAAGVASCKIEGRMKSPLYVAATVNFYHGLLDGRLTPAQRAECEADIQSIFSRPWTTLHVGGRLNPDVVDSGTVGHRGAPAGSVETVFRDRKSGAAWLRFAATRPIERHDGLQIDLPGLDRPFGFAVDALRVKGLSVFEAPAGAVVEVRLPDGSPDIPRGAPLYCSSSQAVKRKYRFEMPRPGAYRARRPLDVSLTLTRDTLKAQARICKEPPVTADAVLQGPFPPAKDPAKTESAARQAFEKLGETRLQLAALEVQNPEGLFVPVSRLNSLRRELAGKIEARLAEARANHLQKIREAMAADLATQASPPGDGSRWSIKTDNPACLDAMETGDWQGVEEVVVEIPAEESLERLAEKIGQERIRLALPLIVRAWEAPALRERIARLRAAGWSKWEATGLASWRQLAEGPLPDLTADWSVYVMNTAAAAQVMDMGASRFTLSPEDGLENMRGLLERFGERAAVIVYQDTPLFISENCVQAARTAACPGPGMCGFEETEMRSSHGDRLLALNRKCRIVVVNQSPFCLADRLPELTKAGAQHFRADFSWRPYSPEEVRDLWRQVRAGRAPRCSHRGNFDRGLL
ncbi:MAG: U32 family peptidase [Verrucomicrobia bacterium]|nr:U32 family peptidase [Verrucomicrobiota bacterium]MBU1910483.1 U32 family peptidase [Verrucomicrobiota bacterium]